MSLMRTMSGQGQKKIFHQKLFALTSKLFYLHRGGDYERTHNDNGRSGSECPGDGLMRDVSEREGAW